MSKLTDKIRQTVEPIITDLGYDVEYIECVKELSNNIVRVVIDKPGSSISSDDCEKVSRAIEDKVDEVVKYEDGYILEISSPGIERQLKTPELYHKYTGYKIRVKLFKKNDVLGVKEFIGTLKSLENGIVNIEDIEDIKAENNSIAIKLQDIATANTVSDI